MVRRAVGNGARHCSKRSVNGVAPADQADEGVEAECDWLPSAVAGARRRRAEIVVSAARSRAAVAGLQPGGRCRYLDASLTDRDGDRRDVGADEPLEDPYDLDAVAGVTICPGLGVVVVLPGELGLPCHLSAAVG